MKRDENDLDSQRRAKYLHSGECPRGCPEGNFQSNCPLLTPLCMQIPVLLVVLLAACTRGFTGPRPDVCCDIHSNILSASEALSVESAEVTPALPGVHSDLSSASEALSIYSVIISLSVTSNHGDIVFPDKRKAFAAP